MHTWTDALLEAWAQGMDGPASRAREGLPLASLGGWQPTADDAGLFLRNKERELQLDVLAGAVLVLADGTRQVRQIMDALPALTGSSSDLESVFATLDALADAGLLTARITPPGSGETVLDTGHVGRVGVVSPERLGMNRRQPAEYLKQREKKSKEQDAKTDYRVVEQARVGRQEASKKRDDVREQPGELDQEGARKASDASTPQRGTHAKNDRVKPREQDKKTLGGETKRKGL